MKMQVVFEQNPSDCESAEYIKNQAEWQRSTLTSFAAELLDRGRIEHSDARKLENGHWSLWVRREGQEPVNHICYLAREDHVSTTPANRPQPENHRRRLVILNSDLHAVSIGRADEYSDIEAYAQHMDKITRDLFLTAIEAIQNGRASVDYTVNSDSTVSIHINRPDVAYGVHLHASAKWITEG